MTQISKIPQNINRFVIKELRKISDKPIEYGRGFDFHLGEITDDSDFIDGTINQVDYDFDNAPKDIFIHNHPNELLNKAPEGDYPLSCPDILSAVTNNIKKIYASTHSGFTAIDLTTVKKSLTKQDLMWWILKRKLEIQHFRNGNHNPKEESDFGLDKLKEFAKFSGATLSNVKWNEYKH